MTDETFEAQGQALRRQAAAAYRDSETIPANPALKLSGRRFTFDADARQRISDGKDRVAAALARSFD